MTITVTELRQNIFKEVDKLIETGKPIEIVRKGRKLKLVLDAPQSKLSMLTRRSNIVKCSDEELIHNDWLQEWKNDTSDA